MSPAIEVRGLSHDFDGAPALQDVDVSVAEGEIFCVFGADGAGKSTLLRALTGAFRPKSGSIRILGKDLATETAATKDSIGYLAEGARVYADLTVQDNVRFFYDVHGGDIARRLQEIDDILDFTDLTQKRNSLGGELSGGQRQRLSLANVLAHRPRVLLMDEPTTGLDPVARRELWRAFAQLRSEGVTMIVATPYLDEVERCDRAAVLANGRIVATGTPEELVAPYLERVLEVEAPPRLASEARRRLSAHPNIVALYMIGDTLRCITSGNADASLDVVRDAIGLPVHRTETRLEDAVIGLFSTSPDLSAKPEETAAQELRVKSPPVQSLGREEGAAISVSGMVKRFGKLIAVNDVSLTIPRGIVYGFLGPNGAGKTTTLRMLSGMLRPDAGAGTVLGHPLSGGQLEIRSRLGYMPQGTSLYQELTAAENLRFFAAVYGMSESELGTRRQELDETLRIGTGWGQKVMELPRGLRQRVALACAVVHRPELLLLDEPSSGMDPLTRVEFWDILYEAASGGTTLVVTTHFMDEADRCERLCLIDEGRIIAEGRAHDLKGALGGGVYLVDAAEWPAALKILEQYFPVGLAGTRIRVVAGASVAGPSSAACDIELLLSEAGVTVRSIEPTSPTLEDVFIARLSTGRETAAV